mmetsp:Transcript_15851/g.20169  ORF Transcript_15851/g.20169 Transcript_15851/m.20169 type:complete len:246 (-) Transcript_15851:16-753(-)
MLESARWGNAPPELLVMIFEYLCAEDVCAVSLVNKYWHKLSQEDSIWTLSRVRASAWNLGVDPLQWESVCCKFNFQREIPLEYDVAEKSGQRIDSQLKYVTAGALDHTYMWNPYEACNLESPIQQEAFPVSRYNQNYYCVVLSAIISRESISLLIDERGDMSLGSIQHPRASTLQIRSSMNSLQCSRHRLLIDQPNRVLAVLVFSFPPIFNTEEDISLTFRYGSFGYQLSHLCTVNFANLALSDK